MKYTTNTSIAWEKTDKNTNDSKLALCPTGSLYGLHNPSKEISMGRCWPLFISTTQLHGGRLA